jgi:uncharacterized protein YyaL (SSP411 family)
MMAAAMLKAGVALELPWAVDHALKTLTRLRSENAEADAVRHSPGGVPGLLDDQVNVALAAIEAYEATGAAEWLDWSRGIMERVWIEYWDRERGGLFDTLPAIAKEGLLPLPAKPVQDAPTPSPNGVAGLVVARLYEHTMNPDWAARRDALIAAFAGKAEELGLHGATFLLALDWQLNPPTHLVIVGPEGDPLANALHHRALATFLPRKIVKRLTASDNVSLTPALAAMIGAGGETRAYACVGTTCRVPVTADREWAALLASLT